MQILIPSFRALFVFDMIKGLFVRASGQIARELGKEEVGF